MHSCKKDIEQAEDIALLETVQVKSIGDYPTLSQYTLHCAESGLIAVDFISDRIHVFDYETLEMKHIFGQSGAGPGELQQPVHAASDKKRLFVLDSGNQRMNVYEKEEWLFETAIPLEHVFGTRFEITDDGFILAASYHGDKPLLKLKTDGGSSAELFGDWIVPERRTRNEFHLLPYQNKIIAVSKTEPVVQLFDDNGMFLFESILDNEPLYAESLDFINSFYQNPANEFSTVVLFNDAAIWGNYLLIHFMTRPGGGFQSNNFMVYRIVNNGLEKAAAFNTEIPKGRGLGAVLSFCVHNNKLYSNGPLQDIYVYNLEELNLEMQK
ncbi:MAG: hypothetical protein JJU13_11900 [Balneolaceae bacterium]|nr:hypothetical protein [Balneolaceae bacterium]